MNTLFFKQGIADARRISSLFAVVALACLGTACGSEPQAPEQAGRAGVTAPAARPQEGMPVSAREAALATQTAVTFGYDAQGRLQWAEYPASTKRIVHTLDVAGNRTQRVIDTTITNPNPVPPTP